jgi:UrcA family protein
MYLGRTNGLRTGIAALIAGLVISQGALADRGLPTDTRIQTIDVSALNLSSRAGAQEAYRRITQAARRVCSPTMGSQHGVDRVKDQRERVQPCFNAAVKGALEQVEKATGIDLAKVAGADRDSLVAGR